MLLKVGKCVLLAIWLNDSNFYFQEMLKKVLRLSMFSISQTKGKLSCQSVLTLLFQLKQDQKLMNQKQVQASQAKRGNLQDVHLARNNKAWNQILKV